MTTYDHALSDEEISEALATLPGWDYDGEALVSSYRWSSFRQAIDFVNDVADLAEERNHHPNLVIKFDEVVVSFKTHVADAVTDRDAQLAGEVSQLAAELQGST